MKKPVFLIFDALNSLPFSTSQAFSSRNYHDDSVTPESTKKKGKRKRSHDYNDSKMRENESFTTSENESSSKLSNSATGKNKKVIPSY